MNGTFSPNHLEQGISRVQKAIDTLRNYHRASFAQQPLAPEVHQSSGGAGLSIIKTLEVIESDFSKNAARPVSALMKLSARAVDDPCVAELRHCRWRARWQG